MMFLNLNYFVFLSLVSILFSCTPNSNKSTSHDSPISDLACTGENEKNNPSLDCMKDPKEIPLVSVASATQNSTPSTVNANATKVSTASATQIKTVDKNLSDKKSSERPVSSYPQGRQDLNEKLFKILKNLNVKESVNPTSDVSTTTIELYDVFCVLNISTDGKSNSTSCEYRTLPKSQKESRKLSVKGTAAEELRMFLVDFPVNQGDSGASTPFIRCFKAGKIEVDCQLAINLNYEGP